MHFFKLLNIFHDVRLQAPIQHLPCEVCGEVLDHEVLNGGCKVEGKPRITHANEEQGSHTTFSEMLTCKANDIDVAVWHQQIRFQK